MSYSSVIVAVFVLAYAVRQYKAYRALAHFGAPWPAGWSRAWLLLANTSGEMQHWFKSANDRYGW